MAPNKQALANNNSKYFSTGVILAYAALVIIGALHHEPWRDEANAWLVARDMDYWQLLKFMSYDGNPPLWHTLLYPFAHMGFPYAAEFVIHTMVAIAMVSIFAIYSPFSKTFKLLFIFSYFMAFEYAVVARLYSLAVLILFTIAAVYRQRFQKPVLYALLVFFLYHTTIPIFGAAFALTLIFTYEIWKNKLLTLRTYIAAGIMFLGPLTFYILLRPKEDNFAFGFFARFFPSSPPRGLANSLVPGLGNYLFEAFDAGTAVYGLSMLAVAIFVLVFILFAASFIRNKTPLFFICTSFLWFFYVYTFKYEGSTRHHGLYIIVLVFALWLQGLYADAPNSDPLYAGGRFGLRRASKLLFIACLISSVYINFRTYYREITSNFSGVPEMARFIRDNGLASRPIAGYHSWVASGILPYNPGIRVWYAGRQDWGSFIKCDTKYFAEHELDPDGAFKIMSERFKDEPDVLFLFSEELGNIDQKGLKLVYSVPAGIKSTEHVWLYEYANRRQP